MIKNFGHNVSFQPKHYYRPKTEKEVLEILNRHKDGKIRVGGGFHAWNGGIVSNDAFLDIRFLQKIEIRHEEKSPHVIAGGGVKLEKLIKTLAKNNLTIPAMGGIMRQSVAGLASTATHGTGRSSFSHYITEIRLAAFGKDGKAEIFEFKDGDELLSARTALGCMGVILSLKIPCLPRYWITERSKVFHTLEEVLSEEKEWPLQQTAVIPYLWDFLSFQRKIEQEPSQLNKIRFAVMRLIDYLSVEIFPHILLKSALIFRNSDNIIIWYYKNFLPRFISEPSVTNIDYKGLTLHTRHHYTFRHVETEIFIPEENFPKAFAVIIKKFFINNLFILFNLSFF